MYGGYPYNAQPWSSDGRDVRGYSDMVMEASSDLALTIYVSTVDYATRPTDALRSQPFRGVLQSFSFERSIMAEDFGKFTTGSGTLVISNADGEYDYLPQSYAIDGRPITLKIGRRDGSYDDAVLLARLTARSWNIDIDKITIDVVDYSYKLEVPMQPNVYGGSGGADGTADMAGKRKPLAFGSPLNVSAVPLVPNLLIYQVHDGAMRAIDAVFDRAVALTPGADVASYAALAAASVAPGTFATCLAAGLFKLGSTPNGTVTANIRGDIADGYITRTADIVRWALVHRAGLVDPDDLAIETFQTVNTSQPAPIDYFIGPDDSLTVAAFIQNIMGGIGGWGGYRLDGTFEVRIFRAPAGSPADRFDKGDMLADLKREPLPAAYLPPRWRWRVPYARNWTVQTDLAGGVGADHRAFVAEPYRLAEASSATIQLDHPFAQDRDPVQAYFSSPPDALAEAQRLIALFKTTRAVYRTTLPRRALQRDMGDVIQQTYDRFDLTHGRLMTVVETRLNMDFTANAVDAIEVAAYG